MSGRNILLAVAVVVAAVLAVGLWLRRDGGAEREAPARPPAASPGGFHIEEVALLSPDLAVELVEIRGTVHSDYTDWACILECREDDGCHADVQLAIEYRSYGVAKKLFLASRLDADQGELMRVGRVQRPPVAVDAIDRAKISVLDVRSANGPRPTEIE
jgi:hypothetical protein